MNRSVVTVLAGVLLASCASSSVQRVGSANYAPISPTTDVAVFTADSQVKQPFEVIGVRTTTLANIRS